MAHTRAKSSIVDCDEKYLLVIMAKNIKRTVKGTVNDGALCHQQIHSYNVLSIVKMDIVPHMDDGRQHVTKRLVSGKFHPPTVSRMSASAKMNPTFTMDY